MIQVTDNIFHLSNNNYSYAFCVKEGKLIHTYYGKALSIPEGLLQDSILSDCACGGRDWTQYETGERGRGDFRLPSALMRRQGCVGTDFVYKGYEILGKKEPFGMPALRDGGQTLKIMLSDEVMKAALYLYYTPYEEGIARRAEVVNLGDFPLTVEKLASASVEFPQGNYEAVNLSGRWGAECEVCRADVVGGIRILSSERGVTSHQHNPFLAVLEKGVTEEYGNVYAFNLIYSGNFYIEYESDEKSQLRVVAGENILHGGIVLENGEKFVTPEAVTVFTDKGLGGMSRLFHRLYRRHLINPKYADKIRPIVINSWESVYFGFDEKKLFELIDGARGLGIDTLVLDDGWFGKRDDDASSLGDWFIDRGKLPGGLGPVIERCKENGLKFGIWFEPEAVSPDSNLYREHPDWALHTPGREGIQMRNQYTLDFSREEVVDYIFGAMKAILSEYDISYVKWDMNRPLSDVPDNCVYDGYVKGVYRLYEMLDSAFPDVLIEGCSSGGGRFDAAILYYSPMIWTSDDTDACQRMRIQYGVSMCYPLQTMSNHVSVCPNHQTGRTLPFATRGAVASLGCLGYELNVAELSEEERAIIKKQIDDYRDNADVILGGELYRLLNPFTDGAFCEEVVASDGNRVYFVYCRLLNRPNMPLARVKLRGLEENAVYKIEERGKTLTGGELMHAGILPGAGCEDFSSVILHLTKLN